MSGCQPGSGSNGGCRLHRQCFLEISSGGNYTIAFALCRTTPRCGLVSPRGSTGSLFLGGGQGGGYGRRGGGLHCHFFPQIDNGGKCTIALELCCTVPLCGFVRARDGAGSLLLIVCQSGSGGRRGGGLQHQFFPQIDNGSKCTIALALCGMCGISDEVVREASC